VLFLLWALVSLLVWNDIAGRLKKVLGLCRTKVTSFVADFHIVLVYIYFYPFLIVLFLFVPFLGAEILGYSLAIILGVFTFGFLFIKIEAYLLALGYLMVTIINTKKQKHALSINKASFDDLTLLPGIGPQLAEKIVNGRPYKTIGQLGKVKGIGKTNLSNIRELIRVKRFVKTPLPRG